MGKANRLKSAHKAAGISAQALADKVGLSTPQLTELEGPNSFFAHGKKEALLSDALKLSQALGCSLDSLLYDTPPETQDPPELLLDKAPLKQLLDYRGISTRGFYPTLARPGQQQADGEGDMSCAKLVQVARALDVPAGWLAEQLVAWWEY